MVDGASSVTVIVTVAVALPPVLLAVTVYVAVELIAVGAVSYTHLTLPTILLV